MHILELDSFKLSDAVKFHNRLNPKLWARDEQLLPEIREKLLAIADDFREFLGIADLDVQDITVSGSNAAYAYTPNSDIDLHLVVKFPEKNDVYQELFNAKKYQYNEEHNLAIGGIPVELYVQDADEPPVSQGEYSVKNNQWIQVPRRKRAKIDDTCVRAKVEDLDARIHDAIASGDVDRMSKLWGKIKNMRQSGLDEHGEFGCENIAFKILRANGCIKELRDARTAARDRELSLAEQNKTKKPFVYGFKSVAEDATLTPDGVNPTTCMFLNEKEVPTQEEIIRDFLNFVVEKLNIDQVPKLRLKKDPAWSIRNHSFGRYDNATGELIVALGNRHIMDVLRTLAHELTHRKQDEREPMPADAGETGSSYENEANAQAGVLMRDYAEMHPEYFQDVAVAESSGYIPTKKQKNDPRFSMALTVDIHPGQTGKEANKMALQTNSQGKPALLMKTANLQESLARELELFEEQDLFEVKMTSKNLANLAKDIPGVKVGLEFEMIVPNVSSDDDGDQEPDYDQDERVRDIDDAINFFDDGDYNYGSVLRRTREEMESSFFDWQMEKIDEDWDEQGFEFFKEYLDREEPFDPADYEDRAEEEVKADYPDLDPTSEEFEELKSQKLREIESEYYNETWQAQGRSYDYAREEFEQEQRDNFSEQDWLESEGIRYASDVQNAFTDLTWPYWRNTSGEGETDTKEIALNFMNYMGYDTIAVGDYHGYGGGYKKWNGSEWVNIGSNKPDDCFTIEPDGSLQADEATDTGLEFVSPPIPLDQIGETMKKVQQWAGENGVYTGKSNATSMHTNISIPGYNLDKLDYLKAALLLGDEHVLRQFDRIGNTYAKPAIEKVKQLVSAKPDKAKELLDKMKSQLNAEASKMIHSGQTDKYTSINTKDNRVEFRSPGGDYLSDIADNPQKMIDTINRMVVTLDAAMDPNKYKEEYQKKLYKVLTGQGGGREAKTGAKQEMKASDKDLLNIFSRYAAGELPKQALKSFVRQAQLQRKVAKGDVTGKMWWNVKYNGQRIEVVADNVNGAKQIAAKEWGIPALGTTLDQMTAEPLRPYAEATGPTLNGRPSNPDGNWIIFDRQDRDTPVYRYMASDNNDALNVLHQWVAANPGGQWGFDQDPTQRRGQPGESQSVQTTPAWGVWDVQQGGFVNSRGGIGPAQGRLIGGDTEEAALAALSRNGLGSRYDMGEVEVRQIPQEQPTPSTTDAIRQAVGRNIAAQSAQTNQGNWGIWMQNADRFANQPGEYSRGATVPLYRFPSREAAEQWIEQQRAARPNMRTDIEVREIEPSAPIPGSTLDLQRQRAAQQGVDTNRDYELYNRTTGEVIDTYQFSNDEMAMNALDGYREGPGSSNPESFGIRRGPGVTNTAQQSSVNNLTPRGPGPWELASVNNNQVYFNPEHTNRGAAETEARTWIQQMGLDPAEFVVRTREGVGSTDAAQGGLIDVAGDDWDADFERSMQQFAQASQAPQTLTRPGQPQQQFTGEWKVVDDIGQELYRFSGVGNAQADANRVAAQWIRQNPGVVYSGGISVLPVMG